MAAIISVSMACLTQRGILKVPGEHVESNGRFLPKDPLEMNVAVFLVSERVFIFPNIATSDQLAD